MDENTRQIYPWTGEWIGINAILEYLSFYGSQFSSDVDFIGDSFLSFGASTKEECIGSITLPFRVRTKTPYSTTPACIDFVASNVFRFDVTPQWFAMPKVYLRQWDILTDEGFVNELFGALDTDAMANYICNDVLINACEEPGLDLASCLAQYNALPAIDNAFWIDGNTRYCRMLHAAYAENNTDHCPHVNFLEQEDVNGLTKCFQTKSKAAGDFFSPKLLSYFDSVVLPYDTPNPSLAAYPNGNCPAIE